MLVSVATLAIFFRKGQPLPSSQLLVGETASQNPSNEPAQVQPGETGLARNTRAASNPAAVLPTAATANVEPPAPKPSPSAYTRQLVAGLCRLETHPRAMTTEQSIQWKQSLQTLVQQGATAVPAILEFLEKNLDYGFGTEGKIALGYGSARAAMFDALAQIGGPEGLDGLLQVLRSTADPREIALLAQNLEKLAPEQHRQEAVAAAVQALSMAAGGKLQGTDVAPLFEVIQNYGGTSALGELERAAKQWNYYATIGLAQLPEGAGIPALIQMAQGNTGASGNALEMLAQMSPQYPEARGALLEMARANKISPNLWPYLTPLLAGDQYHYEDAALQGSLPTTNRRTSGGAYVVVGNQHFFTAHDPASLTPEQVSQRTALIEELRSVTSDPAAVKALQAARALLENRLASASQPRVSPGAE